MQTFTIGLGRNWCIRALGSNPLVRTTDRIEAVAVILAIFAALVAVPIAGSLGTLVHDVRTDTYAEQVRTRHLVAAIATADSSVVAGPTSLSFAVPVKWSTASREHLATLSRDQEAKAGDRFNIWVDDTDRPVNAPASPSRADFDAVAVASLFWCAVVGLLAGGIAITRWSLNKRRYTQWEREIDASANGNGGRTNQQ